MSQLEERLRRRPWLWGCLGVFLLALFLRLLFLLSTPDSAGAYAPYYKGDAPIWLDYARALQEGRPFELGLPLRPPGMAYLLAALWNGRDSGLWLLRLTWCVLGAATAALMFLAVGRSFGSRVALVSSLITAASAGLMILSTSINNEAPYLLLVVSAVALWPGFSHRPSHKRLAAWSLLNGLACLFRVEHSLFFGLATVYLAWAWSGSERRDWSTSLRSTAMSLAIFAAVLLPWQLHAWSAIQSFNATEPRLSPTAEQAHTQVERALAHLTWDEDALREKEALPLFCRRAMSNFVAATVVFRGGTAVTKNDFSILDEAFGSRPTALTGYPFLVLYGPLNFFLANNTSSSGGFGRAPLDAPPQLAGGEERYPRSLIMGLPPPQLTLVYPPHLQAVNQGYRLGLEWMVAHPWGYIRLVASKLQIFWSGASLGLTGYNLPLGLSGIRRPVDLVVPEGWLHVSAWRMFVLLLIGLGLLVGRRQSALIPWLLFAFSKTAVTLAFFGYAREGAVLTPVVALLVGLAVVWIVGAMPIFARSPRRWLTVCLGVVLVLATVETARWLSEPLITLDGVRLGSYDPFPATDYKVRMMEVH